MSVTTTFIGGDGGNPLCEEAPTLRRLTANCASSAVFEWDDDPQATEYHIALSTGGDPSKSYLLCPEPNTDDPSRPIYQSDPSGCQVGEITDDLPCDYQLPVIHRVRRIYEEQTIDTSSESWQDIVDRYLDKGMRRRFLPDALYNRIISKLIDGAQGFESSLFTFDLRGMGIGESNIVSDAFIPFSYTRNSLFPSGSVSYETPYEAGMPYTVNFLDFYPIPSYGFALEYGEESRYKWYLNECLSEDVPGGCDETWQGCVEELDVGRIVYEDNIYIELRQEEDRRLSTTNEERDAENQYLEQRQTLYPGYLLHDGSFQLEEQPTNEGEEPIFFIKNTMFRNGSVWNYEFDMEGGGCMFVRLQARYGWNEPYLRDPTVGLEETYYSVTNYSNIMYAIAPPVIKSVTVTECWSPNGSIDIESDAGCAFMDVYVDGVPENPEERVKLGSWSPQDDLTTGTYNITINTYSFLIDPNNPGVEIRCNGPTINRTINVIEPSPQIECRGFDAWEYVFDEAICDHKWQLLEECSATCNCFPGCTDVNACNYDDTATLDDGSCWYPETGDATEPYCSGTQMVKEVYVGDCSNATEIEVLGTYTCEGCYNPVAAGTACSSAYCSGLSVLRDYYNGDCANTCYTSTLANCDCDCVNASCINFKYDHASRTWSPSASISAISGCGSNEGNPCTGLSLSGYSVTSQGSGTCVSGTYSVSIYCCISSSGDFDNYDASFNKVKRCSLGSYGGYDITVTIFQRSANACCFGCLSGTATLTVNCGGGYCP